MPLPGSQVMNSIDLAYFLHNWQWVFRGVSVVAILGGIYRAFIANKWLTMAMTIFTLAAFWMFNFKMAADVMFYQPNELIMVDTASNQIPGEKLVLGLTHDGVSKAYPIQLIAYHHQVLDTINGKPIMVTYCSVCRTGRIFEPLVNGTPESFRLVGMDHFNAMFEDERTKSWWRQANGEALIGPLEGTELPELMSEQATLQQWVALHPETLIMQPDSLFMEAYESMEDYDFGVERGELTRTDTLSWKDKSWVVGMTLNGSSHAVDWNELKEKRIVNFQLGATPVLVMMASDDQSFYAFERPNDETFTLVNDTLLMDSIRYNLLGQPISGNQVPLKPVKAYQEFWHSWRTFHPDTTD